MLRIFIKYFGKRLFSSNVTITEMKYFNVAEKHDAAKTIAGFLSKGSARRREGYSVYNKVFDFEANVFGRNVKMVMTSVSGHLLNYEFLMSYKNWQNCDPQQLFDAPIRKSCTEDSEKIKKTLEREVKSCNGLIIWTDCDREGENIGFEIIQVCKAIKPNLTVYRAKFSEITGASVRRALANLTQPDKKQNDAVDIRQELDLRTGAAFTRFQTLRLQRIFPVHIADNLISYGSCQIPTLGFVAKRYKEIEEFVSEPFWKLRVTHTIDDLTVEFIWDRNRLFDKDACEDYLMLCLTEPIATVVSVTTKPKNKWRPCPMDTVELEKLGSRKLKLAAKEVMTIAERLYTQGIISYPRTETTIFSPDVNLRNLVEQHISHPDWGRFASRVLEWGPNPRKGNKSDQAHPPIHPLKFTTSLNGNEQRVYELIVRHFLACVSKDATGSETVVNITMAGEKFHATGLCIYERNYLDVYIYEKWNAKQIHRYENGQTFEPTEILMQEGCTTAPPLLTEADLIALMDKHGIGTDATHAEHIHKIKERGYIGEAEGGLLVPGTIGMGLYEGYDAMELSLAYPMLRAEFESDLKKICIGEKDPNEVLREQIIKYKHAYKIFTEKIRALDEKVAYRLNETIQESHENNEQDPIIMNRLEELFKCPKCKKAAMALRRKKNNTGFYIGCLNFPECRNSVWFSDELLDISLENDHCNRCGPGYRMMTVKFKQNNYLMLLNAIGDIYTTCIGCDSKFQEIFDINLENVKNIGRIVNNENNVNIFNSRNRTATTVTRGDNTNNSSNNSTSTFSNNLTRTFSTNIVSLNNARINSNRNINLDGIESNGNLVNRGGLNQNNPPRNLISSSDFHSSENSRPQIENIDDLFGDDSFADFFINTNLELSNSDNNLRSQYESINNNLEQNNSVNNSRNQNEFRSNNFRSMDNQRNEENSFSDWNTNAHIEWSEELDNETSTRSYANIPWGRNGRANMTRERAVKCSGCHQPAKLLTVRKDGPNKGRDFYKCPKQSGQCQFFVWADETNQLNENDQDSRNNSNNLVSIPMRTTISNHADNFSEECIMCNCQQPAKNLTVRKDGPNKGRSFYGCCNGPSGCRFFKWADEDNNANAGQDIPWGSRAASTSWDDGGSSSNWGTKTSSSASGISRDRSPAPKRRKCSLCRQEGHTKIKCPRKEEFDNV